MNRLILRRHRNSIKNVYGKETCMRRKRISRNICSLLLVTLLYSKSGLGDRLDDCEIAYQTYGNS